jgi:hypothetical protein
MSDTVPTIKPILQIQDPTAFPRAIPESPSALAVAETTSSGSGRGDADQGAADDESRHVQSPPDVDAGVDKEVSPLRNQGQPDGDENDVGQ